MTTGAFAAAAPARPLTRMRPTRGDAVVVAYAALFLVTLALQPGSDSPLRLANVWGYFGIGIATVVAQFANARDGDLDGQTRTAWKFLAVSSLWILIGGITWTAWLATNPVNPDPDWSSWLTVSYIPFAIAAMLRFPRTERRATRDRRAQLDIALLAVAGLALSYHFSVRPLLVRPEPVRLVEYLTHLGEWGVFVAASVAFIRARSRVMRTAISLALAAHVGSVLADASWFVDQTTYQPGDLIDGLWFVTWVLRWTSARYAWHAIRAARARGDDDRDNTYRSGLAPTAMVAGAYVLLFAVVIGHRGGALEIAAITGVLTLLLIVRLRAELLENQRLTQQTLAQGERFRALLSHAADYIAVLDDAERFVWASPAFTRGGAAAATPFADLVHPDDRADTMRWLTAHGPRGAALPRTCRLAGPGGTWTDVELRVEDRRDDTHVRGIVINGRDISGERALEGRLRHAEKLVTLHDVAGRIAHAFNNLLAMIAGHAELLATEFHDDPVVRDDLAAIRAATDRGAGITRQLLGFSGRNVIQPVRLPVAATIEALAPALGRTLPEGTTIALQFGDRNAHVTFDRAQFEQVLVNLVANARDAMPGGGVIRVSVTNEALDASPDDRGGETTGIVLRIRDAGVGIAADDLQHIFEPFFTTKAPGLGTGLGLAMVDTIVRRAGGRVSVESAVGIGTIVAVHLPLARPMTPLSIVAVAETPEPTGRGVVLLVDDEPGVRRLSRRMLERGGFTVIEAAGGAEAIAICDDGARAIDILVTDMMMPGVSGRDVIARFSAARPGTPIVVVTGFAAESERREPLAPEVKSIVAKPFTATNFLRAVNNALGLDGERPAS